MRCPQSHCRIFSLVSVFFSREDFHTSYPMGWDKSLAVTFCEMKEWRDWKSLRAYTGAHSVSRFLHGIPFHPPRCLSKAQDQRITFPFLFRGKWGVLGQWQHEEKSGISLSERLSTNPPDVSLYPCLNFQMTWYLQSWNFSGFCSVNWLVYGILLWNSLDSKLSLFFHLLATF